MWKAGLTEAGSDALLGSLGAEIGTGQVELAAAELALFGVIMGVRKIKEHHQEKKSRKQQEEQAKADADQRAKKDAEDAENARLEEIARQQEIARIEAENKAELDRQQHQEMEEAKIQNAVVNAQSGLAMVEYDRESRIHELEIEHGLDNQDNGWQMPIPPRPAQMQTFNNVPRGYPDLQWMNYVPRDQIANYNQIMQDRGIPIPPDQNAPPNPYPNPRPNNGGNGGNPRPNNGGNGGNPNPNPNNGGNGGNPNPNPNNGGSSYNMNSSNPYYDLISAIARQIQTQKNKEADKKEADNKDKPVIIDPTDPTNKTETDEILDNQHLMQQELEVAIGALGEQQLTEEEMLVQLESIEKMIDNQIPDQVKVDPYSVFSSDIVSFN